jgi:hypothetical protein
MQIKLGTERQTVRHNRRTRGRKLGAGHVAQARGGAAIELQCAAAYWSTSGPGWVAGTSEGITAPGFMLSNPASRRQ